MRRNSSRHRPGIGSRRAGASAAAVSAAPVVAVTALLAGLLAGAPAAVASPDNELIWEEGHVSWVSDGDTLVADLDAGSGARGTQRIRTIGVQAPEVAHSGSRAECGASQATTRLKAQLPAGAPVQTRSVDVRSNDDHSGGRIVRSLYAQDEEGNWYDTSRGTVSDGWLLWFPLSATSSKKPEWAHNLEYRVLADDAASQKRGLWQADLCGRSPDPKADLRIWAKYWGTENVYVENRSSFSVDLSNWTIRDSAISGYRTLPAGTVIPAGGVRLVYSGDMNLNNLPADNSAFVGDAVFLMDDAGKYGTGNLRAWFPYPCNPDSCDDVLTGALTMSSPVLTSPPTRAPSDPGSVTATASTSAAGSVTVTWAAPNDPGAPSVTYSVGASAGSGATVPPTVSGVKGLSRSFTGLTPGKAYLFWVRAENAVGASRKVQTVQSVVPAGVPGTPAAPTVETGDSSIIVSWPVPGTGATDPALMQYTATASIGDVAASSCTVVGATSCVITGLANETAYRVRVVAANSVGTSARSAASAAVTPVASPPGSTPAPAPGAPSAVVAAAGDRAAVVAWTKPAQASAAPVATYAVTSSPAGGSCTASGGARSCVVTGLTNATAYTFTVVADNGTPGAPSAASAPVTPFGYVRTSGAGSPPPAADPWIGGQHVDITNTSKTPAKLGGYGLWDAQSSHHGSGAGAENRAAYLFAPDLTVPAGGTLRVHFLDGTAPAGSATLQRVFAGADLAMAKDSDFVELANLNGAQIACRSKSGTSCLKAKVTSAPSAPVGVTARTTTSKVTVSWGAPISRGGLAITRYTATAYDAAAGGKVIGQCSASGTQRTCSLPGRIGVRYHVDVVATNAQGTSGPSWRVLAAPRTVPGAPGTVTVSGTPGGLNVSWTPAAENGATITRYVASVYRARTGGSPVATCSTGGGTQTGCTIFGLSSSKPLYVSVRATNRVGAGPANSPRVRSTADAGRATSAYSNGTVTVRWDAPLTAPAAGATGYSATLYTKATGGKKVGSCTAAATATSCTTGPLKLRSDYYIALTATTEAGAFTVKPRLVTGPPRPAPAPKVTSGRSTSKRVVIRWSAPGFTGYSTLVGYEARLFTTAKGSAAKASCTAPAGTPTCTTVAVKKGTYYAAVRVSNGAGWSGWSNRVAVKVR